MTSPHTVMMVCVPLLLTLSSYARSSRYVGVGVCVCGCVSVTNDITTHGHDGVCPTSTHTVIIRWI